MSSGRLVGGGRHCRADVVGLVVIALALVVVVVVVVSIVVVVILVVVVFLVALLESGLRVLAPR